MVTAIELLNAALEENEESLKDLHSDKKSLMERLKNLDKKISEYCSSIEDLKNCIKKLEVNDE